MMLEHTADTIGPTPAAGAKFMDEQGYLWHVHEAPPRSQHAMHDGDRSLYFFSRLGSRRLDDAPGHWPTFSWAELNALCSRAAPLAESALVAPRLADVRYDEI